MLARRKNLRSAFVVDLKEALAELSWTLVELETGGFGAMKSKVLEAAKPATAKRFLTDEELKALRRGRLDFPSFEAEALAESGQHDEGEDD